MTIALCLVCGRYRDSDKNPDCPFCDAFLDAQVWESGRGGRRHPARTELPRTAEGQGPVSPPGRRLQMTKPESQSLKVGDRVVWCGRGEPCGGRVVSRHPATVKEFVVLVEWDEDRGLPRLFGRGNATTLSFPPQEKV